MRSNAGSAGISGNFQNFPESRLVGRLWNIAEVPAISAMLEIELRRGMESVGMNKKLLTVRGVDEIQVI